MPHRADRVRGGHALSEDCKVLSGIIDASRKTVFAGKTRDLDGSDVLAA